MLIKTDARKTGRELSRLNDKIIRGYLKEDRVKGIAAEADFAYNKLEGFLKINFAEFMLTKIWKNHPKFPTS